MPKVRDERGLPKEKSMPKGLRSGGPSASVPGDMKVVAPLGARPNRSAARYADATKKFGGADGPEHKYGRD